MVLVVLMDCFGLEVNAKILISGKKKIRVGLIMMFYHILKKYRDGMALWMNIDLNKDL